MESTDHLRIDKWLWHVRIFKTRTLASEACRAGHVRVGGDPVKPAQRVRLTEVVTVKSGVITRTLRVIRLPERRIGPKAVEGFLEDLTPPEEYEKLRDLKNQSVLVRLSGSGRPTKKDRRAIDRLFH